jgi:hypothetical protein
MADVDVSDVSPRISYTVTSAQSVFTVPFVFFADADLLVYNDTTQLTLASSPADATEYSVVGAGLSVSVGVNTLEVTLGASVTSTTITIVRDVGIARTVQFPTSGAFAIATLNTQLSTIFAILQQVETLWSRAIRLSQEDTTTGLELPVAATRASSYLGFDGSGQVAALSAPTDTTTTSAFMATVLDDGTAAAALTTLTAPGLTSANTFSGINTFNAAQRWAKGGDISSASPLVLDTDGNYFDVTGTTGFSAITVAAGTIFMLQFDGALVLTHGSSLDLPGEANITTAAGDRLIGFAEAADTVQVLSYVTAADPPGRTARTAQKPVTVASSAVATHSTALPTDDTIPQKTEGDELFTLAITPKATANRLVIDVHVLCSTAAAGRGIVAALFQDTTANALAATAQTSRAADQMEDISFQHEMAAGTTSSTTFKVRVGNDSGSMYINGISTGAARVFGGVASSRMTITEYWA